jgi:hypothetical protein
VIKPSKQYNSRPSQAMFTLEVTFFVQTVKNKFFYNNALSTFLDFFGD